MACWSFVSTHPGCEGRTEPEGWFYACAGFPGGLICMSFCSLFESCLIPKNDIKSSILLFLNLLDVD